MPTYPSGSGCSEGGSRAVPPRDYFRTRLFLNVIVYDHLVATLYYLPLARTGRSLLTGGVQYLMSWFISNWDRLFLEVIIKSCVNNHLYSSMRICDEAHSEVAVDTHTNVVAGWQLCRE